MTSEARHRRPPTRRRNVRRHGRRGLPSLSHTTLPANLLYHALGLVLLFASCVVLVVALIAAAALDVWAGAFGGLLAMVTAVVGYGLVARILP